MITSQRFGKSYKLCSRKAMDDLFASGKRLSKFPLRLVYKTTADKVLPESFQVMVSVPKRSFKKAHDRNRIKRLMREALRKNKTELESLLQGMNMQVLFSIQYTHNEIITQQELDKQTIKILSLLQNTLVKGSQNIQDA